MAGADGFARFSGDCVPFYQRNRVGGWGPLCHDGVEVMPPHTNTQVSIAGPVLYVGRRQPPEPTCRDEVLAAIGRLVERTGEEIFTVSTVFMEMADHGTRYKESAVYKTMQRMKSPSPIAGRATLERVGRRGFRLGVTR